jgi:predicted RNA binding protein YcfA (HicA-like mRNA interferase family)
VPNIEKLRRRLMSGPIPSNLPLEDLIALYESLGFTLDRIEGSHHMFTKPRERPKVVAVHHNRPSSGAVRELVKLLRKEG